VDAWHYFVEFLIQSSNKIEQQGQRRLIPAGSACNLHGHDADYYTQQQPISTDNYLYPNQQVTIHHPKDRNQ